MAHVEIVAQTGVGQSPTTKVLPGSPFNIGFGAIVSGTATYTIRHTFNGSDFFDHEFLAGKTGNEDGNYAFPIAGIQIDVTAGTGTVTLTSHQAR